MGPNGRLQYRPLEPAAVAAAAAVAAPKLQRLQGGGVGPAIRDPRLPQLQQQAHERVQQLEEQLREEKRRAAMMGLALPGGRQGQQQLERQPLLVPPQPQPHQQLPHQQQQGLGSATAVGAHLEFDSRRVRVAAVEEPLRASHPAKFDRLQEWEEEVAEALEQPLPLTPLNLSLLALTRDQLQQLEPLERMLLLQRERQHQAATRGGVTQVGCQGQPMSVLRGAFVRVRCGDGYLLRRITGTELGPVPRASCGGGEQQPLRWRQDSKRPVAVRVEVRGWCWEGRGGWGGGAGPCTPVSALFAGGMPCMRLCPVG